MLVVADYCTEDGRAVGVDIPEGWAVCWAGIDTIAAESEYQERTVRRVLDDMEAAGVIRRERRTGDRGYRQFDLIWVEHARRFVDLTDSDRPDQTTESDNSYRTQSPVGPAADPRTPTQYPPDGPVDNPPEPAGLPDSDVAPTGLWRHGLPDSDACPPHPPIRKNPQLEPPTNHQDHPGNVRPDRTRARRRTRSSSKGPAPPAPGDTQPAEPHDRPRRA